MHHFKEACSLYIHNILTIFLVALTIGFPLQLVEFSFTIYGDLFFSARGLPEWTILISIVATVLVFNLIQLPFISMAVQTIWGESLKIGRIYRIFIVNAIPTILISVLYLLGTAVGLIFLIIPGIFMLALTLMFPYIMVIERKKGTDIFKRTFAMGRSHIVDFALLVIGLLAINAIVWYVVSNGLALFESNPLTFMVLRMAVNVLLIPLFTFVVTLYYSDWSPVNDEADETDSHHPLSVG